MLALIFQIGPDRIAVDVRRVKEVVPRVALQPVAAAPAWLAGAFVYRGQVVPVLDLHRLVGAGECPPHLSSRIILVPQPGAPDRLLGLLAARVSDLRDIEPPERSATRLTARGGPDLGAVIADRDGILHLLDLDRLLPDAVRCQLLTFAGEEAP
jgi:chemotaxis-related protein WspB